MEILKPKEVLYVGKIIYLDDYREGVKIMACVDIEQKAKELLQEHELYEVPVDPIKLAEILNVEVYQTNFKDDNLSGVISKDEEKVVILTSSNEHYNRTRFTVAHELGHLVLHMNKNQIIEEYHRGNKRSKQEMEANAFAAALLMPIDLIKPYVDELDKTNLPDYSKIKVLAEIFKVSESSMGYRMANLGLIRG